MARFKRNGISLPALKLKHDFFLEKLEIKHIVFEKGWSNATFEVIYQLSILGPLS